LGQGMKFDGVDDHVGGPHPGGGIDMSSVTVPYTVAFWFTVDQFHPTSTAFMTGDGSSFPIFHFGTDRKIHNYNAGSLYQASTKIFTEADLNTWWHLTYVVSSSTEASEWEIYLNGVDDSGTSFSGDTLNEFDDITFGGSNSSWYLDHDGKMDDVRIYDRALSAKEVEMLYQLGR